MLRRFDGWGWMSISSDDGVSFSVDGEVGRRRQTLLSQALTRFIGATCRAFYRLRYTRVSETTMDLSDSTAVVALGMGLVATLFGWLGRHQRRGFLIPLGLSFVIGPLSPLLREAVPDWVRILFSTVAIGFAALGVFAAYRQHRPPTAQTG